jgi:hypothetical protein
LEDDLDRLRFVELVGVPQHVGHHLLQGQQDVVAIALGVLVEDDRFQQGLAGLPDQAQVVHGTCELQYDLGKHVNGPRSSDSDYRPVARRI